MTATFRMLTLSVLVWACLAAAGVARAADYRVGPGDVLAVEVFSEPGLTRTVPVRTSGDIPFPLLGSLAVAGLTVDEVALELQRALEADYLVDPHVTVRVEKFLSQKIEVIGAVKRPGKYYLTGTTTLREILTEAGWLDSNKSSGEVKLVHADGTAQFIARADLEQAGSVILASGDVINALEDVFVFVDGEVNKPGAIKFSQGLTVSQAVTRAGGTKATARLRKADLLRDGEIVKIHLRRILEGNAPDIEMRAGDQLRIKESPI